MTTHYIEEAERLCDRVAIIDDGVIIAIGSPRELQEKSATQSSIEISLGQPLPVAELPAWPDAIRTIVSDDRRKISVSSSRAAEDARRVDQMDRCPGTGARRRASQSSHARGRLHRADRQTAPRLTNESVSRSSQDRSEAGQPEPAPSSSSITSSRFFSFSSSPSCSMPARARPFSKW